MEGISLMDTENPSTLWRKRLSDITNITSRRSVSDKSCQEKNPISAKDYIGQLLKENNALMRLIGERNKIIEMSGVELQKLKFTLQMTNQQNWQLAQANSQMLAELNLGKDRLKTLQHELGCTVADLKAKTRELEEGKKLAKQGKLLCKINHETLEEEGTKPTEHAKDPSELANCKKACSSNSNRKRTLRSRSLGPTVATHQETKKENDEGRRRALRRRSSDPRAELFEKDDVKQLICSHEEDSVGPETSVLSSQNAVTNSVNGEVKRSSLGGRPMRRAAEKVCSYKEVPLNIKLRRED